MPRLRRFRAVVAALALTGCAWDTREAKDHALVLGMGTVLDALARMLTDSVRAGEDPLAIPAVAEPDDGSWTGDAGLEFAPADPPTEDCGFEPCADGAAGSLVLAGVLVRGGGDALLGDEGWDCAEGSPTPELCDADQGFDLDPPDFVIEGRVELALGWTWGAGDGSAWHIVTTTPARLRATALGLDRTADVTIDYAADWDEFNGRFVTRGTVDGDASGYDWSFND